MLNQHGYDWCTKHQRRKTGFTTLFCPACEMEPKEEVNKSVGVNPEQIWYRIFNGVLISFATGPTVELCSDGNKVRYTRYLLGNNMNWEELDLEKSL